MRRFAIAAALILFLVLTEQGFAQQRGGARGSGGTAASYQPPDTVQVVRDIVYATYGNRDLLLDLYLPSERGAEPIPGIVVIRGGGWQQGDKDGFAHIAGYLASSGFAAVCVEYRAAPEATFPAAVNDTKAAVRWLRAHAAEHGINPATLGAIGGSAGAHLAAMLAVTHRMDELDGEGGNPNVSNRVQAVVAMATPADLLTERVDRSSRNAAALVAFLGATYQENPDLWVLASPISHVHAGAAPILLMHSDADQVVSPQQSVLLKERYEQAGLPTELVTIEAAPHAFWGRQRPWHDEVLDRAVAFFRTHLVPR